MLRFLARKHKPVAWSLVFLLYFDLFIGPAIAMANSRYIPAELRASSFWPGNKAGLHATANDAPGKPGAAVANKATANHKKKLPAAPFTTGPTQPEMQSYSSVNSSNMVDLFSGDFSYNIPLMDVGGYPLGLSYQGGISMDQEASWVGLGWNINPGTITRNLRGLPDDFNGASDSVRKTMSIRENKTIGVTGNLDVEIVGLPANKQEKKDSGSLSVSLGVGLGVFHNNYKGWGLEHSINASINSGIGARGGLSGGLSLTNNSQEGLTMAPSFSISAQQKENVDNGWMGGSFSISSPYNTRSGIKGLQLTAGVRQYGYDEKGQKHSYGNGISSFISFASPSYTPSIQMPFTSRQFSFTAKVGWEVKVVHPSVSLSGYVSKQRIDAKDTLLALPSYGYLYYQDGARNRAALLDFNREKEIPYREKPAVPHIAIPQYTYDAFSITGEGTGGMFRAYRGDIGFVYDHFMRTKDESDRVSVDVGLGDIVHGGVDLNINRAFTQNGPWLVQNPMQQVIDFKRDSGKFEAVYFRNPGEKSINSKEFYNAIGGDDVVTVGLFQADRSNSVIQTTNYLTRYKNFRPAGTQRLSAVNAIKTERDKRTQVISYLTAKEADAAGLSKYIENYTVNLFDAANCGPVKVDSVEGSGKGLPGLYFKTRDLKESPSFPKSRTDPVVKFDWGKGTPPGITNYRDNDFSIRWTGRVMAPKTGRYTFVVTSDDGVRLRVNDSIIINRWNDHAARTDSARINLIAGELYKIQLEYYERGGKAVIRLEWAFPGQPAYSAVPMSVLYAPAVDTFRINNYLIKEKRVNGFRKDNHLSEITVLNNDGRRYVYGIPVYNLKQKEATFAADGKNRGNAAEGLVGYTHGIDNSTQNTNGKDRYYNSQEVPAYAHSFLLSGILSPDYSDLTGNGISDDDIGDAVKFNYSKIRGVANPYAWRAPAAQNSATFNEGLKTDYRDDKGSYVYGEKELWYLHSIESKTMMATFVLENRSDLPAVDETGLKIFNQATKRLKEINLYSKADFMKKGVAARPVKTVHFEYTNDLCPGSNGANGKLTLKRVWFTYNGNEKGKQNPYVFNYSSNNPSYNLKSYDRWGNYKDPAQNPGSVTGNIINNADYPYTLQDSLKAAQNAAAWALDSIYLPSGGSLKIDYEGDDYAFVQNKRAMQLFKVVGVGNSTTMPANPSRQLYTRSNDHLYVYVCVPKPVSTLKDVYTGYLAGVSKLYFKLFVQMPADPYGNGSEYVSCYADLDIGNSYGIVNSNIIWLKIGGISLKGDGGGSYSPLAKAAIQFLRLNLPSKAYPGSEVGDNMDLANAVKMLASMSDNIKTAFSSFDRIARERGWAANIDTNRTLVRLNSPYFKKLGGGHRVKRITIYDNWNKMTNQRAAVYGQEYIYTTQKVVNGDTLSISSGVAGYEPGLGGEENPFHQPVEYVEKIAPLGPVTLGYSEEPLGESFFPAAGVGYSSVRTRTIHYKNKKSANGYEETKFYTAYDFPVYTDRTLIDDNTKKRYKPGLANFLRVNAKHYISLSQGFKIELNDMHGKLRSKAVFAETDPKNPISYTENIYRVENKDAEFKRLSNAVMVMKPDGSIDTAALIGKDVELMVDMREQLSVTNGYNVNLNTEMFSIPFPTPPFFLIPSLLNLAQREENIYRSVATVKIIQRYGVLDSAIQVDKGSKVTTRDMLYDSETGDVLLTRTQNEFNDDVYHFNYPSHWAYDGMGLAYKNIGLTLKRVSIREGKLIGFTNTQVNEMFSSGDEIMVAGQQKTADSAGCFDSWSFFPAYSKIWAVDSSELYGGAKAFYFIDRAGKPYNGNNITLKIIRSGRRNIFGNLGSVTSLENPIKQIAPGQYALTLNTNSKIIAAKAGEFRQFWKVEDLLARKKTMTCLPNWKPTGHVRCIQQNGVNTGYQEGEETDFNFDSPTYGHIRWVLLGFNCIECGQGDAWVTTGNIRCVTDNNGVNTGYQEREETDTSSCSGTSGQTRWVTLGQNCTTCPKPQVWTPTGNTRCVKDGNNNNTGFFEREESNTESCSPSPGATRWVSMGQNCATCPKPQVWTPTGNTRCIKDGNNNNTGYQEREESNTEPCSASPGATRWVSLGQNCTTCPRPAKWTPTNNYRCAKDGSNNNTGYQEREEIDTAVCSGTTNTTRWVNIGLNCSSCPSQPANWVPTSEYRCQRHHHPPNPLTGYLERKEINTATCSGQDTVRWVTTTLDCVTCAGGTNCPACDGSNCSGNNKKCVNGVCETSNNLTCVSSAYDNHLLMYYNCFKYQFSDGSYSTYEECWYMDNSCFGGASAAKAAPKDNKPKTSVNVQVKETSRDLFYRSVLPQEKYIMYREKQQQMMTPAKPVEPSGATDHRSTETNESNAKQ